MIKIIGLLNLDELFVFKNASANLENAVNAAYKFSEDGAKGIAIYGKSFRNRIEIASILKDRLDIPASPVALSIKQLNLIKGYGKIFSLVKPFSENTDAIFTEKLKTLNTLKGKGKFSALLVTNKSALRIFHSDWDYLDEIIALTICKAEILNVRYFLTENVLSARKGAELCRKLF